MLAMTGVQFQAKPMMGLFPLRHRVQTDSRVQPTSYSMGTGGSFRGGKVAGTWG